MFGMLIELQSDFLSNDVSLFVSHYDHVEFKRRDEGTQRLLIERMMPGNYTIILYFMNSLSNLPQSRPIVPLGDF